MIPKTIGILGLLALLLAACYASPDPENTPTSSQPPANTPAAATAVPAMESPPASETPPVDLPRPSQPPSSLPGAAAFPDPEKYSWEPVISGLNSPVALANAGDGSNRLFVLEQEGRIRIIQDGQLLPEPFLDIRGAVSCCGERGLLGIAFHPRYAENGFFYVHYTDEARHSIIARFRVSADRQRADPVSQQQLLVIDQPYSNHNGGHLAFGPDDFLYIALGDGGSAGDPLGNGQSLDTLLGKLLRIDVDGGEPYAIPADNPYAKGGGRPEIWAYGLRNPWRFSFGRQTGDLYIGDVGQNQWEEVNFLPAGSPGGTNFGWDFREGAHPFEGTPPAGLMLTDPIAEYPHNPDYSITGGYVYGGLNLPEWRGVYVYGDFASGRVWGLLRDTSGQWQSKPLFATGANISAFGEDEAGELYLVDYKGNVYRLSARP